MKKQILVRLLLLFSLSANASDGKEAEKYLRIASQQARCMDAVLDIFPSKEEENTAYSKFYKSLVGYHKKYVEIVLKHEESGMPQILKYVGSTDILVGMVMQGTMIRASEHNNQYDEERAGKSVGEFNKYVWDINGCDAMYSSI